MSEQVQLNFKVPAEFVGMLDALATARCVNRTRLLADTLYVAVQNYIDTALKSRVIDPETYTRISRKHQASQSTGTYAASTEILEHIVKLWDESGMNSAVRMSGCLSFKDSLDALGKWLSDEAENLRAKQRLRDVAESIDDDAEWTKKLPEGALKPQGEREIRFVREYRQKVGDGVVANRKTVTCDESKAAAHVAAGNAEYMDET